MEHSMYHFTLNGVDCACDTVHELLRAIVEHGRCDQGGNDSFSVEIMKNSPSREVWLGTAGEKLDAQIEKITKRTKLAKRKLLELSKCKGCGGTIVKTPQELKDLPKLDCTITWDVARRIGKKFKRTDLNQLRTDLKQRQQLP
jgi:hypothetical protein